MLVMHVRRNGAQGEKPMLFKIIAVIFLLFVVCFIAIIIEETFLGGRRRRRLERQARERQAGRKES